MHSCNYALVRSCLLQPCTPTPLHLQVRKLYDCGELPVATAWTPLAQDRQSRMLVGRGQDLLLLSHNDMTVLELQLDTTPGSQAVVQLVATSHSQTKLAAALDSGLLWLGTLSRRLCSLQLASPPSSLVWCGEDAVLVTLDSGAAVLVHTSGATESLFLPAALCLVAERDGVRLVSQVYSTPDLLIS